MKDENNKERKKRERMIISEYGKWIQGQIIGQCESRIGQPRGSRKKRAIFFLYTFGSQNPQFLLKMINNNNNKKESKSSNKKNRRGKKRKKGTNQS